MLTQKRAYRAAQFAQRNLVLNIAPVQFDDAELKAGILQFESKEQLESLRKTHWQTHIFKRATQEKQDEIFSIRLDGNPSEIGDSTRDIKLSENLGLTANLIRDSLLRYFHRANSEILDFAPIKIVSRKPNLMLLSQAVPAEVKCPDWLGVNGLLEIDVRVIAFENAQPFVGLVLNVRTVRQIKRSCDAFLRENFDLPGLYVTEKRDRIDPRVAARHKLLGCVIEIAGSTLKLADCREDRPTIEASSAWLEPRPETFSRCLVHAFGSHSETVRLALETQLTVARGAKWKQDQIAEVLEVLTRTPREVLPEVRFFAQPILNQGNGQGFPTVRPAPAPIFIFDDRHSHRYKAIGLDSFGPYSRAHHTPTHPRVCVVCQRGNKGEVEQFLRKFFHGISSHGGGGTKKKSYFEKGFLKTYHLENVSVTFFSAQNATAAAYRKAAQLALEEHGDRPWDLALVQVDEITHESRGDQNPYLVTKASFMSQQIPVQEFETETMRLVDTQLEFALSNMGIATYSKLGGVPCLLQADRTIAHELVIGMGSTTISDSRLGAKERIVGITTMFTGDGNYFVGSLSKAAPFNEYKSVLLESLHRCVHRARTQMNWQKGDHLRLIFHSFKPLKDTEAEAVKEIADSLSDYSVEFAFVHIVENHPLFVFDTRQNGKFDYENRAIKGEYVPDRGLYLRLNSKEILLTLTGPSELKKPTDGMPAPVLLRLHRHSNFHDISYLAKQVFFFSGHSWRSMLPASMPVTILYSQLMARLLGKLGTLPQWNPDSIIGKLNRSRWFL
jgi:Piwi domain